MASFLSQALPIAVVLSHAFLAFFLLSFAFRRSWGRSLVLWVGERALALGLAVALMAVLGSLFYSNAVGFEPCLLCWWQRIALYPLLALFTIALWKRDRGVFAYVLPLSVIGAALAIYHSYVQWGGNPLIPCDATASCSKLYVLAFGYVTIPTMSLTIAATMIILYFANRFYQTR